MHQNITLFIIFGVNDLVIFSIINSFWIGFQNGSQLQEFRSMVNLLRLVKIFTKTIDSKLFF